MISAAATTNVFEATPTFAPRPGITHVVFDFDGTLSWLRHGWPEIMLEIFLPLLPRRADDTEPALRESLLADIYALNGKLTIHQMSRFAERVRERGGTSPDPETLRQEFQATLDRNIAERSAQLREGKQRPDDFVVHGGGVLLEKIAARDLKLFILSGTLEDRVRVESELVGVARFFGARVIGSRLDEAFSKLLHLEQILREERIPAANLLAMGDGAVEIEATKTLGGLAIGVASDETHNGSGVMEPHKRRALIVAGADAIIPDYREPDALLARLLGA